MDINNPLLPVKYLVACKRLLISYKVDNKLIRTYTDYNEIYDVKQLIDKEGIEVIEIGLNINELYKQIQYYGMRLPPQPNSPLTDEEYKRRAEDYKNNKKINSLIKRIKEGKNKFTKKEVYYLDEEMFSFVKIKITKTKIEELEKKLNEYSETFIKGNLINPYNKIGMIPSFETQRSYFVRQVAKYASDYPLNNLVFDEKKSYSDRPDYCFIETLLALEKEGFLFITDIGMTHTLLEDIIKHNKLITSSKRNDWVWARFAVKDKLKEYFTNLELPKILKDYPNYLPPDNLTTKQVIRERTINNENIPDHTETLFEADISEDFTIWKKGNTKKIWNLKKKENGEFFVSGKNMFELIKNLGEPVISRDDKENLVKILLNRLTVPSDDVKKIFFNRDGKWGIYKKCINVINKRVEKDT